MRLNSQRKGELLIFGSATLWGLFPVITVLSYHSLSPLFTLIVSNIFAALFFVVMITQRKKWHELSIRKAYKDILLATLFTGIIYYVLIFLGLQFTSPGNASIVALTEVFFSFIFFHVFKKEKHPSQQIIGAGLMILGALFVLLPGLKTLQSGDILILIASAIAPFGNFYQQKARRKVASETIMLIRSILSTIVIFSLAVGIHSQFSLSSVSQSLLFLIINGIVLLGLSKIFWLDGIHHISVPKANALSCIGPIFTLLFAWLLLKQTPTMWQVLSLLPIFIGINLLSKKPANAPNIEEAA